MLLRAKLSSKDGLIHEFYFWIVASAAYIPDDKPNGVKTLLVNGVSARFIYYKPTIIDGIRKFKNRPYWLVIFLVISFNEIPLFSKDLISFIISFISCFVRVIAEPVTDKIPFLIFSSIMLIPASTRISSRNWFFNTCNLYFFGKWIRWWFYFLISATGRPNIPSEANRNYPNCTILDNWTFANSILADEPFAKALHMFETCILVNNDLCGKQVSSLECPILFDERFKVTSVPFFIADFNLLSYDWDNFTFKVL